MATLYNHIGGGIRADNVTTSDKLKDFLGNVTVHIPTEILGVFLTGLTLASKFAIAWTVFCWIMAIAIRWKATNGEGKVLNIILAGIAFPIWVAALSGSFLIWDPNDQLVTLAVLGFSILAGFLYNNK